MYYLAVFGMRILEGIFLIGLAGSTVVVLISFVEDIGVLFERDRPRAESPRRPSDTMAYPQPANSRGTESAAVPSQM